MQDLIKKGLSFLCAAALLFSLSACGNTKTESTGDAATEEPEDTAVLSVESAVDTYFQNMDVWVESQENLPMGSYGYCLLDLDFDGVLELIVSVCDGSGRYSTNRIYKIDPKEGKVTFLRNEESADPDYYYLKDKIQLLRDNESGRCFYLVMDYTRAGSEENAQEYYEVAVENGTLSQTAVFSEVVYPASDSGEKIRTYTFRGENCPKAEYDKHLKQYYEENTDLNLKWTAIDGETFAAADDNAKKELFRNAYTGFSYDGFSFAAS